MKKRSLVTTFITTMALTILVPFSSFANSEVEKVYVTINSIGRENRLEVPELSSRDSEKYYVTEQYYEYYDEDGGEGYIDFTIKAADGYYFKTEWNDESKIIDLKGNMAGKRNDIDIDHLSYDTIIGTLPFKGEKNNSSSGGGSNTHKKNGWHEKCYYVDGKKAKGWKEVNGSWYFFDLNNGVRKEDWWIYTPGKDEWYYLNPNGTMISNSTKVINSVTYNFDASGKETSGKPIVIDKNDNKEYRFQKRTGSYYKNEWVNVEGRWFYTDSQGYAIRNTWKEINEKWYYFYNDGVMAYNTWINGYYVGNDGAWIY